MNRSPLLGKYFVRRPTSRAILRTLDKILEFFSSRNSSIALERQPQKILLSNLASLGDVVIATCVLPPLKKKFPEAKIGFLIGSWAHCVLQGHPLIDFIHHFDHVYLNGSAFPRHRAFMRHWETRRSALQQLRSIQYDLAIDLYCYFPNAIPFLAQAKIPIRIGYETGGFGPLLTHRIPWQSEKEYTGFASLRLLQHLGIELGEISPLPHYSLRPKPSFLPSRYILLHAGSSSTLKDWPLENWKNLVQRLFQLGFPLVLTGKGTREEKLISAISQSAPFALNFCNQLSWEEFVGAVHHADLLISADSVAVHLAAAHKIPTLVLFCGMNAKSMWLPPHPQCKGIQKEMECSPCFRRHGCKTMACIRELPVERVFWEVKELLDAVKTNRSPLESPLKEGEGNNEAKSE